MLIAKIFSYFKYKLSQFNFYYWLILDQNKKYKEINGAKRTRTADPLHAMQVLYQLSYGPIF